MITAMKAGRTLHRMLAIVTVALVFASSRAQAQQWEDSDVGAPAPGAPVPAQAAPAGDQYVDTDPSALTDFRSTLDPHGRWINDPTYGVVWVPSEREVGRDFAPYVTNGHWAQTAEGDWIWVSSYPFGWVVFHYGRWVWITGTGWAWIPGRQYAPAWVVWRVPTSDYAYVGWAPMPPSYVWVDGAAVTLWFTAPAPYVFCHSHYFFHHHVHHHIIHDHHHVSYIAQRTRVYRPISRGGRWRANPTVTEARVPSGSAPRGRTPADPRAVSASRRQTSARVASGLPAGQTQRFSSSRSLGTTHSAPPASGYGRTAPPASGYGRTAPPASGYGRTAPPASGYGRTAAPRPAPGYAAPRPAWGAAAPAAAAPPARFAPPTSRAAGSAPRTFVAPSAPAAQARPAASAPQRQSLPSTSSGSSSSAPRSSSGSSTPRSSWSSSSGSSTPRSSWSSSPRSSWSSSPRSTWSPSRSPSAGSRSAPARIRR